MCPIPNPKIAVKNGTADRYIKLNFWGFIETKSLFKITANDRALRSAEHFKNLARNLPAGRQAEAD